MEIEKPKPVSSKETKPLREGDVVRVKVLSDAGGDVFLVDVRGKLLSARLSGGISSSLFIARVVKTAPLIELKFIRSLERGASPFDKEALAEILQKKKTAVRRLPVSGDFTVEEAKDGAVGIKEALKRIVGNLNPSNAINEAQRQISEFFVLQSLMNLVSPDSLIFLFPFMFGRKKVFCDLQLFGGRDAEHSAVYLSLLLENDRKIGFLVFLDHELVKCTVAADDESIERLLKENAGTLLKNLKTVGRNRAVNVSFVPYGEHLLFASRMVKKIDVRM
jgi:hypothetical protein